MWWKNKIRATTAGMDLAQPTKLSLSPQRSRIGKVSIIVAMVLFFLSAVVFVVSAAYLKLYQNKIYPGVYLSHFHVGGLSEAEVKNFLESLNNRLAKEGIVLSVEKEDHSQDAVKINTVIGDEEGVIELVAYESITAGRQALSIGRVGPWWERLFAPIMFRFFPQHISAPIIINAGHLRAVLKDHLSIFADTPHDANIKILNVATGQYEIIPEQAGRAFVYDDIIKKFESNLAVLSFDPIIVRAEAFAPEINTDEAGAAAVLINTVFSYGGLSLNYIDPQTKVRRDWNITPETLAEWIQVKKDDTQQPILSFDLTKTRTYLEKLRLDVEKTARDAKFVMADGVVKEFQASQSGLSLNIDETASGLLAAFEERNYHPVEVTKTVGLAVTVTEPDVKMSETNDLGIADIIGVGVSSFKGSHTNRIKNIALAVSRLNGTLIRPGEEFSANRAAGPFTAENGFLPELVIKGNEIKTEIGGGMCQIGTTLFRMAMNSGMPITARRNHSLVVNYYADPINGNPGTDATLYEPILDFKFLNDSEHYLLVQTAIDYKKQELAFTLWGQDDGRKGWYTHPTVSKWIPSGEPREVLTDKLKPGTRECQSAYRGAVASFTYSRITPAGEKIDRVFESYYRPLPMICMVGTMDVSSSSTPVVDM